MNIHEYQAKEIFRSFGVPTPRGGVAFNPAKARKIAKGLGGNVWVVKAQIHAGGRGKGKIYDPKTNELVLDSGVRICKSLDEVESTAKSMLKNKLVTIQTGEAGKIVRRILVEEGISIARELYAGVVLDRSVGMPVVMVSTEGGVEIEKVAAKTPEKILKKWIDPSIGFQTFQARELAYGLKLKGDAFKNGVKFLRALAQAYKESDASLVEINPLVVTKEGQVLALDAKMNFDDNALYRHPGILKMRDTKEEDPLEVKASAAHLNYIKLDGNVGCMVNGAGLAMATMDMIKLSGGEPANFLDVGGSASAETVEQGFRIILADKNVKAILINIFGGIVRADRVAQGVVQAAKNTKVKIPIVVRLAGTNAEKAGDILAKSGLSFRVANNLKEAAASVNRALTS